MPVDEFFKDFRETGHEVLREGTVRTKVATWGELTYGDCHQIEGTLTLYSDGRAHFGCVTYTNHTHSGDVWWAGFTFLDHSGVTLHNEKWHYSPRMDDGNGGPPPRYRWTADFAFNPAVFDAVTSVRQGYKC